METYCNSECDESLDVSVEDEEEDEDEPQEGQQLTNSLKNLNQNSGRRKAKSPDTMDIDQSEDSGLTWETSSSRCSTSQASETSATSGVSSMNNSNMDSPPGKVMEERITEQKTRNSLDQMPSFADQNTGMGSKKQAFSLRQASSQQRELDLADPLSWPYQVQPSKIKEYLIQITQEVETPLAEEKDNSLKKKGELPLKGTVRARIEQITAVLEERNKRIFRRVNGKDMPPAVIEKPKEPPKIFSRQGISVSLRHVERDTRNKDKKKEILHYNLKPVQTNISKPGVPAPYKQDERKTRKPVLPETPTKASEKPSPTLPPLANKANKLENESYLPVPQTSVLEHTRFAPPDHQDKEEKKAKQSFLPDAARVRSEKSAGLVDTTEQQTTEQDLPMATEAPHVSEAPRSTPERKTAQPGSPVPGGPLSYSTNKAENQTKSTVVVPSESAAQDVPYPNIMKSESVQHEHEHSLSAETASQDTELHPSQPEIKDMASLRSAEETRKQDIPPYSPAASLSEQVESPHSVMETVKQETNELEVDYLKKEDLQTQPTTTLPTEPDHIHTLHSEEVSEAREAEMVPDFSSTAHRTEIQERPSTEEHLGLPQLSHLMGEAEKEEKEQLELNLEKQGVQTQTPVTASLESECQEVSSARDKAENQTIQLEFQQTRPSFPTPTVQWEEVHQHSVATVQSESEQPVISEPVTTLQGSEHRESSHLRDTEVTPYSPTEIRDETSEQLPSISSLFDSVEKQETQPPSLRTAIPLSEQPNSVLPQVPEQMEERGNLLCSPEKATLISEVPLPTVAVQTADVTKLDIQPDSTTKAPSEELVSISSESADAEKKTVQPDLPLSAEPSPEPAVQLQEAAELQNHASPSIKADLYSEVQGASCHIGDDNKEGDQHLFATTQLEDKDSVMSETKEQNLKTRDSMPLELEVEAGIALSSADEADNKIMHKSISEPSQTDSVGPMHVPEKQERVHLGAEQTPQLLSSTNLQKESNVSCAVEEGAIKGIHHYVPATAKDLSESVCSTGPQDAADFSTGAAALDSGLLTTPNSEAMTHDIAAPVSEYVAMQPLEAAVVELQPAYVQVSPSTSESRKHFDVSFPVLGAEEEDSIMIPQSDSDHQVQSEAEGKEAEHYSPMTPTSSAATESQRSQGPSSSEAPKQSLKIPSFLGDTESLVSSELASEQSDFLLSDWNNKAEKEEIQAPFPKKPETVPEEPLSITAFLLGETREESLHSSRAVNIVPKESKAIPEDDISEAVKETAPSFSPVSEEHLTKETFSSFVAEAGEEQDWSHSLLTEESKQLAAEKADVHNDESHLPASQDVNLYCPVTAESELDNRIFLNSTEEISKEEGPQHLLSTVQSAPIYQELLYHGEERDTQERIPLETKHSKSLQSPILQQESEHLDLRQPIKELEMEAIQPYSSAAIQDLSLLAGEKGTSELQDNLPKMEEVDFGVSKTSESVDEAKKKEIQPPSSEELEPCASSLLTGIWEEQGIRSPSPEASTSAVLGQLTSASMDFTEKAKEPKVQPCPPVRVLPEEPLSIASFLLSEAKEMQTSLPKTAQKENLDSQLPFKESDFLVEGSRSISACPPDTDVAMKREIQPSLIHVETEQLSHDLQPVFTDQGNRENIHNIPTVPNLMLNESSDKITNKAIVISTENIAEKEEIKNLPHADVIRKEPENDLQKEKELKDNEKSREKATTTGEPDQAKDISSSSEDYVTVTIHAPPPASSVDKEENMHMPEKLNDLETVSSLQTKAFNLAEDLVGDQKISMCKPGTESLETADIENKESELKELVREADIQGTHDLQPVLNDQDMRENICNIPTIPNSTLNESSDTVPLEPRNGTQPWSAVSDKTTNKAIVISTENIAGREEIKNVPHADVIRKEPENNLQKEKELKDNEKTREKAKTTGELDQGKDMSSNSEDYATVTIHVPPPVSSVDKEENKHMPEKLNDLETISSLQTKMFNLAEDLVVDQKISMCKSGTDSLETADIENKESELKELVREADIQVNRHNEKEILAVPGNKTDGILNASGLDYFEKITVTDDTSFTQAGKELSVQEAQMPLDVTKENVEETPSPAASLENILEFSLLESTLDKKFNRIARKENAPTSTQKGMSKVLKEDKLVDVVRKNDKNIEEEINLVGATLFDVEKVMLSQTPSIPLPDSTVNPEFTVGRPALASWNRDVYENAGLDSKEDSCKHLSDENIKNTYDAPSDEITAYFEGGIAKDDSPNNLEDSQRKQVLKDQHLKEEPGLLQGPYESNEKEHEPTYILAEASSQAGVLSPREIVKGMNDALIERPAEISSDVKVVTCQPLHAIPFGSRLYHSGATSDENSQNRAEESSSSETSQMLPEETSDEESSPILDYAATVYPKESSVQDDSKDVTCLATDQTQQPERTEVDEAEHVVRKPVEEATSSHETFFHVSSQQQNEGQLEGQLASVLEPVAQGPYALDHEHLPSLDFDGQTYKKSIGENIITDLAKQNREDANQPLSASGAKSDKAFGELDFSLLSHDFDSYPLYSIKEEEYSDDEDLAELMEYEIVTQDDVFQKETPSEEACEEGFLDDRKSLDPTSDSYEFVNEKEGNTYAEEEERMGVEKFLENVPENEVLQGETELAQLDTYCCECRCPISADDKLWGGHRDHSVTNLDTGVTELKGQLDGFMDVLQERSLKIEESVSEIEALFNTLEENCKGKEQLLEEQNENIVKTVLAHHDQTAQRFEEIKSTKLEYLYEQMVIFQEYIDTAKETLEIIVKETEEMDDCAFLRSSEELNKRLLSAVEDILTSEKMPTAFSHFEHFAGNSASGAWTLASVPVPQTPKLQPQEPNSATSTSIAIYWTVSEEDVIDFFQVYCMEENPGRQEQSGLVEEYRVTVKESNCILEDLEPGHCYSVWIMAVNYTGCSFPSEKSTFRTAPPTPVMKAEDCTVCWDTATIRWSTGNPGATDSFTLEYCRQYSPEGEGLRSLAGIKRPELKVNLEPNINYFFYVRAVNAFGTSEQSEAALISTKGTRFHLMKEAAHPALQVSPNGTMICLPKETQITGISPVWGELLSSQGRHYWEVTVTGCEAYKIGICYSTILPDGILGQNDSSWCLYCSSKTSLVYKVLHKGEMSDVIVTEHPARIGVLLDYNAGRLLFFNAERGQVLFGIRRKFTAAAHPAFGLEQPGILHLHTGMELPEFVDHS